MGCTNLIAPSLIGCSPFEPERHIVTLNISDSDRKIINMILNQHYINEISFAGPGYGFDKNGRHKLGCTNDLKIRYDDIISGKSHFRLFIQLKLNKFE